MINRLIVAAFCVLALLGCGHTTNGLVLTNAEPLNDWVKPLWDRSSDGLYGLSFRHIKYNVDVSVYVDVYAGDSFFNKSESYYCDYYDRKNLVFQYQGNAPKYFANMKVDIRKIYIQKGDTKLPVIFGGTLANAPGSQPYMGKVVNPEPDYIKHPEKIVYSWNGRNGFLLSASCADFEGSVLVIAGLMIEDEYLEPIKLQMHYINFDEVPKW